jgi:hypothetical protein
VKAAAEFLPELREVLMRHVGRRNAVKAEALAERFGCENDRPVRRAIKELIDGGFPVCSATDEPAGYFFPSGVEEARRYSKSLQSRAVRIFLRRRRIVASTARWYEKARQMEMMQR